MSEVVLEKENITRKPGPFEKRIHEIDFIRGFLIGLVVIDHIFCFLMMFSSYQIRLKQKRCFSTSIPT